MNHRYRLDIPEIDAKDIAKRLFRLGQISAHYIIIDNVEVYDELKKLLKENEIKSYAIVEGKDLDRLVREGRIDEI
jgi:predicted hydrocarbon binding protein